MSKYGRLNGFIYCCIYGELQRIAWENGYSLAVHGSMERDFDVVAIPWTEAAISAEDLITNFHEGIKAEFEQNLKINYTEEERGFWGRDQDLELM